jgi:hypothetical protein
LAFLLILTAPFCEGVWRAFPVTSTVRIWKTLLQEQTENGENGMMTALVEEWRKNYVWKRETEAKR